MIGIDDIARRVVELDAAQSEACGKLRAAGRPNKLDFLEGSLLFGVGKKAFSGRVAAVDGGLTAGEFHAFCLVVSRAVGVSFDYADGKIVKAERVPVVSQPQAFAECGLEGGEFELFKTLVRLELEVARAREVVEKFKPNLLLLDGTILPLPQDKPAKDSPLYQKYFALVESYKSLFAACLENNCVLAGVVKDSNSRHFLKTVSTWDSVQEKKLADAISKTNDSAFLHLLLNEGERTAAFAFSENENPRLRDFGNIGATVCGMYLKPAKYDRPLRVDFLLPAAAAGIDAGDGGKEMGENAFVKRLAEVLNFLSLGHRAYAYPAVLVEADLRAALDPKELDFASREVLAKVGRSAPFMQLRRNTRPFR